MLIRSQDKELLVEMSYSLSISKYHKIDECMISSRGKVIGRYSTKEKAIKVLDMIQMEYAKRSFDPYRHAFDPIQPKVFQMPKDNEVDV